MYGFTVGQKYSRREVCDRIGYDARIAGGPWVTGYFKWGSDWILFINLGEEARTGHQYQNRRLGEKLWWQGKTGAKATHPSIKEITGQDTVIGGRTLLFVREKNRDPFTFWGVGEAEEVTDETPVRVLWKMQESAHEA